MSNFSIHLEHAEILKHSFQVEIPEKIKTDLLNEVTTLAQQLRAEIQGNVQGAVLKVKSGKLSNSIFEKTFERPNFIGATVGAGGAGYVGRFFEKGYDGIHSVSDYMRSGFHVHGYERTVSDSLRQWLSPVLDANRENIDAQLIKVFEQSIPENM